MKTALFALSLLTILSLTAEAAAPQPASTPLVEMQRYGGRCRSGDCRVKIVIYKDGLVTKQNEYFAQITPQALGALSAQVNAANFNVIRQSRFQGPCPTSYDGNETVFTFFTNLKPERLDSCETVINPAAEPFAATLGAIADGLQVDKAPTTSSPVLKPTGPRALRG